MTPLSTSEDVLREVDRVMYSIKKQAKTLFATRSTARLTSDLLNALEPGLRLPPTLGGRLALIHTRLEKPAEKRLKRPVDGRS